ncbi:MAG: ATP-dependent DNA helicase RecG [Nitrospina sp.]|nr:ATP-dependent DNA helicase RecG [Nitrospina sp.]MBT3509515.1 ATP-dependent DNA helicase RecG [Nitrospina sp.]MBT3877076.1 ATP-dependent DNA helicase RecG [Nitrospina sp.]MBT4050045.1 ATP-dependent DNA helicase RecG [Nitrospina sp.]MBT4558213.1 ATP-dependent DNA helicase RecG [Nitrospina sp.]
MKQIPPRSLEDPIQFIKGVGPRKAILLEKLRLTSIEDCLYFLPFRFEDRTQFKNISQAVIGEYVTLTGEVLNAGTMFMGRRKRVFEVIVQDKTGVIRAKWFRFNETYMKEKFKTGQKIILSGKSTLNKRSGLEIIHPDTEQVSGEDVNSLEIGKIVPVYHVTDGLHLKSMRTIIKNVLDKYLHLIEEFLPNDLIQRHEFISRADALSQSHFPPQGTSLSELDAFKTPAQKRLVFEELFLIQLGLAFRKKHTGEVNTGTPLKTRGELIKRFVKLLPFTLTGAQKRVLSEIMEDLEKEKSMNRLIQGDVGSGKTIVALTALLTAVDNKMQSALMVPTEILAEQHYLNIRPYCESLGIELSLITSALKGKERQSLYENIRTGKTQIIVGTHSLIQKDIQFKNLGLAVVDEQHRFGVLQRDAIGKKGDHPHLLIMTATPIPRSLALTLYGDMDVSLLDEFPPGRKKITTEIFYENRREKAYGILEKQLQQGRQAFVVCPLIEESDVMDLKAAVTVLDFIKDRFPDYVACLIHGKLKKEERQDIMSRFLKNEIQVLVSTTVIEVGIDVPNATAMIIEHAERFGLAQLHQLRGRVGRGAHSSHCLLMAYHPVTEEGQARMKAMQNSGDGFIIAEEDLKIRGPGDFMGTRQSGMPLLKIANLLRDIRVLETARKEAFLLIDQDPDLKAPEHQPLNKAIHRFLGEYLELMQII